MKYRSFLLSCFVLTGCSVQLDFSNEPTVLEGAWPQAIQLEDDSGNKLGYATPLRSEVLVAPDHLWQEAGALFYQDQAIEVLARDFRHDVLFLRVPNQVFTEIPAWSTEPPGVGQKLQWGDESAPQEAPIYSAKAELGIGNFAVENLMLVDTVLQPGDSGRVLHEPDTDLVYGMLVGTDKLEEVSYLVRSDLILGLAEEYLD